MRKSSLDQSSTPLMIHLVTLFLPYPSSFVDMKIFNITYDLLHDFTTIDDYRMHSVMTQISPWMKTPTTLPSNTW